MATKFKAVEAHRLTISGVGNKDYGVLISALAKRPLKEKTKRLSSRSHAIASATYAEGRLRLRLLSFSGGYRPDVLDMNNFSVMPNPLTDAQTGIEWTHIFGGVKHGHFVLLIEKVAGGISPSQLELYLQWFLEAFYEPNDEADDEGEPEDVAVTLEPIPASAFEGRLKEVDRIKSATVRTVRPNPGWFDLESGLAAQAEESDAARADVTFTARRSHSLKFETGIVAIIKDLLRKHDLAYASITGERQGRNVKFNTKQLAVRQDLEFPLDARGQVMPEEAWQKMGKMFEDL